MDLLVEFVKRDLRWIKVMLTVFNLWLSFCPTTLWEVCHMTQTTTSGCLNLAVITTYDQQVCVKKSSLTCYYPFLDCGYCSKVLAQCVLHIPGTKFSEKVKYNVHLLISTLHLFIPKFKIEILLANPQIAFAIQHW